jgi:hypothetical protein
VEIAKGGGIAALGSNVASQWQKMENGQMLNER